MIGTALANHRVLEKITLCLLYELLEQKYVDLLVRFEQGYYEDEDVAQMENALNEMAR